jgi:Uma2 family endonuclease
MVAATNFDWRGEYDENLPIPERLSQEQYRRVIFRPDAHFVDGRIIPRVLGDSVHGHTVGCVCSTLQLADHAIGLSCCISLRLQVCPSRIRVCDIVVLKANTPYEPVPTVPPLLCVEVLAPGQLPQEELDTLTDYLGMGVQNLWLIDPLRRAAFISDATGLHEADPTQLSAPNTPIHLDLTEAFAAID